MGTNYCKLPEGIVEPDDNKLMQINCAQSKSFGIEAYTDDGSLKCMNIIQKNTILPVEKTISFTTAAANQMEIPIKIYENYLSEEVVDLDYCNILAEQSIRLPSNLPAGSLIDITFKLSEEGILSIEVLEVAGKNKICMTFNVK